MEILLKKVLDFLKGLLYGVIGGVFAFSVGFLLGELSMLGYSLAWIVS